MNVQVVRCISMLLIGVAFFVLGGKAISVLVVIVGVLLMVPGMWALVSYVQHVKQRPMFPLAALGSSILGLWMVMSPLFFVSFFMYVLGVVLVALGVSQLAALVVSSHLLPMRWPMYMLPVLVLLLGMFVLLNPFEAASIPFILIGIGCVVSAVGDLIAAIRLTNLKKNELSS